MIEYLLDHCVQAGVEDVLVVTGYQSDILEREVRGLNKGLSIRFVFNPRWELPNGLSVLVTKPLIPEGENFLISMSDHMYDRSILERVMDSSLATTTANVGLDFNLERVLDMADAMKVRVHPSRRLRILEMGKDLKDYDAVDCGVFKCRHDFFMALEAAEEQGHCSLSNACSALISEGKMGGVDIDGDFWIDVDTPSALRYCIENHHIWSGASIELD